VKEKKLQFCRYKHKCGHACLGLKNEDKHVPCLEPDCIEAYNNSKAGKKAKIYDGFTAEDTE